MLNKFLMPLVICAFIVFAISCFHWGNIEAEVTIDKKNKTVTGKVEMKTSENEDQEIKEVE